MMFARLAATVSLGLAASATAQRASPPPPKLVVAISIDQFSSDLFASYRPHFTGGLKRLSSGTTFRNGYQSHAATETCPGHSTILTGTHPARNGIVANNWFDPSLPGNKKVYCAEDERRRPAPPTAAEKAAGKTSYTVSAVHLKVPTLGDRMKAANPASRVVSVAGKDRAAVMLGGKRTDQIFWWAGSGFKSNMTERPAAAVEAVNANITSVLARPRGALVPPPVCANKTTPLDIPGTRDLNVVRFARAAGDASAFRNSPELDGATLALAAGIARELALGRGTATDLLAIGLSATDYVGHAYGSGGLEQCLNMMSLDRDLGDFLGVLDATGVDYSVMLTADHGVLDVPERSADPAAARLDAGLTLESINAALSAALGLSAPTLTGEGIGDLYVDRALAPAMRARVMTQASRILAAHPQVHAVLRGTDLAKLPVPVGSPAGWTVPQRVRASYDPQRSGDLIVILRAQITPISVPGPTYAATHGSPWDYDRRVPIMFWRKNAAAVERLEPIATVDILPTLAAQIGIDVRPDEIDGRCQRIAGASCPID